MDEVLTTMEVAARLGVDRKTICAWIREGHFPGAFKINPNHTSSAYRIPLSDVETFEALRRQGTGN